MSEKEKESKKAGRKHKHKHHTSAHGTPERKGEAPSPPSKDKDIGTSAVMAYLRAPLTPRAEAAESFRRKKESKAVVTSIVRAPVRAAGDRRALERDASGELARFGVDAAAIDSFYQPYAQPIYANLAAIVRAARTINAATAQSEFVVLGFAGAGKSALVEALLGAPVYAPGHATRRPVHFRVQQNATLRAPAFALARAGGLARTTLAELPAQLAQLAGEAGSAPVHVLLERPQCVNLTLIDTPGLGGADASAKQAQTLVASLGSPTRRYICVEAAPAAWQPTALRAVLVALDPRGTRTTHVYTAAHVQFRNLRAHDDALRYVNGRAAPDAHFVAGLSLETRRAVGTNLDLFRERVVQAQMRLQSVAKAVGLDPTEHRIGLKGVLDFIYRCGVENLERQMPAVLDRHRAQASELRRELTALSREQDGLEPHLLRAAATRWADAYGRALLSLLAGSVPLDDAGGGQTLRDERIAASPAAQWSTTAGVPLSVPERGVVGANVRLVGVQQLHRLAREFRSACGAVQLDVAAIDEADVATARSAGPPSAYQRAFAASDIAARKALALFGPLVAQLFERAVGIVSRLPDYAVRLAPRHASSHFGGATGAHDGVLLEGESASERAALALEPAIDVGEFPFVLFRVRDAISTKVHALARDACRKCVDELRCFFVEEVNEQEDGSIADLAQALFEQLRPRVIDNVVLKYQCFFVNRCVSELGSAVYSAIAVMPDAEVEETFRIEDYRERLERRTNILRVRLRRVVDSQDRLEAQVVQSDDPTIRKSFIVRPSSHGGDKGGRASMIRPSQKLAAQQKAAQLKAEKEAKEAAQKKALAKEAEALALAAQREAEEAEEEAEAAAAAPDQSDEDDERPAAGSTLATAADDDEDDESDVSDVDDDEVAAVLEGEDYSSSDEENY